MNNALKRELAVIVGTMAAVSLARSRKPLWSTALGATAAGLWLSSLKSQFNVFNKSVYITGGSRGLGLSLAWNLVKQGATVTLAARDEEELLKAQEIILRDFPNASVFLSVCDVTNTGQLRESIGQAQLQMDGIDLLINNAGAILIGKFESMTKADFDAQLQLHLYATIDAVRTIIPYFRAKGGGRILNICSLGGKVALPHMIPYDVSKFALAGFSQGLAAEVAEDNIHITTAFPTVMRTGSAIQAVFKGDHEEEFAWFAAMDNMPFLSMSADTAAKKIIDAVCDGQTEVILSLPAKTRMVFGSLFPEIVNAGAAIVAKWLPKGNSLFRKTGADSSAKFFKNPFFYFLRKRETEAERRYNQSSHHDAEYNMSLLQ